MQKLYYAGIKLQKDLEFCEILKEIESTKGVYIISKPEECEVVEMRYCNKYNTDTEPTGKTHIGYDSHYVNFVYKGYIFYIQASSYYPFVDDNHPGQWNFIVYKLINSVGAMQSTYYIAYDGIESIDEFLNKHPVLYPLKDVYEKYNIWHINRSTAESVKNITSLKGSNRERAIFDNPHFIVETGTWNSDHKVVNIIALEPDEYGHRDSYAIDLIERKICG